MNQEVLDPAMFELADLAFRAALIDRVDVLEVLLEWGADASRTEATGRSARELASMMGAGRSQVRLG